MTRKIPVALALTLATLLSIASIAQAQSDCKTLVPPSPFGPNDQTGATNRVTAAGLRVYPPGETAV